MGTEVKIGKQIQISEKNCQTNERRRSQRFGNKNNFFKGFSCSRYRQRFYQQPYWLGLLCVFLGKFYHFGLEHRLLEDLYPYQT